MPRFAGRLHGNSFSTATRAAINAIQATLMTPSVNSAAMSAQQQPTHQAACSTPIRSAPRWPSQPSVVVGYVFPSYIRAHAGPRLLAGALDERDAMARPTVLPKAPR